MRKQKREDLGRWMFIPGEEYRGISVVWAGGNLSEGFLRNERRSSCRSCMQVCGSGLRPASRG